MPYNLFLHVNRKFRPSNTFCLFHNLLIQVFLVTGGYFLDSTELYDPSVGSWVVAGAKLPTPMSSLRAINIDDRILIFGI